MKKFLFFCLINILSFFSYTAYSYAEDNTPSFFIKGTLIDSLRNETVPYASIRIYKGQASGTPVKMAVTDNNGKFNETFSQTGDFTIVFSSVGMETVLKTFTLNRTDSGIDFGIIYTTEATKMLEGVEIVAQKPLVKAEIDKISYSMEDDPEAKTNTTLEMLRKVPLITVDGEDNIRVNGSGNFKIYVNGKPNTLMSNNPKEVLKSLPASSIKKIEVITDPGAKYDAEGVGGIINIVTTDTKMQGYNVTLGTRIHNKGVGAWGYGTVQVGKFTVSGNYSYNYNTSPDSYTDSGREDFTSSQMKYLTNNGIGETDGNFQFGNLEGSYEIDSLNLITFSANIFGGTFDNKSQTKTLMSDADHQEVYRYNTLSNSTSSWRNIGINFDYQHSFKKKGEYLTVSYKFENSPDNSEAETYYEDAYNVPFTLNGQYYDNDAHTAEHTAQIDYVNPINDMHYIDAGVKYIDRLNASDSKYYLENSEGILQPSDDLSSKFDQRQDILAVYADYQLKWKNFGFKAGARYEHTFMNVKYAYMPEQDFSTNFDDVVPSVNLSYMLSTKSSLKANYNMRINRPGIWFLNPFRNTSNPTSISYGNPDLKTEKAHSLGITYSYFSAKFSINATLNHRFINNGIESYSFMNNGIQENTYGNMGKSKQTNLLLWVNWNPGNKTRISINAAGAYADYKSDVLNAHNHGFNGGMSGDFQQTLPLDIRLSLYGGGSSPFLSLQGKNSSYFYYGINFNRSFLKDKRLDLGIFFSNIFNKYHTYRSEINTDTFRSWNNNKDQISSFGLSVSWRFGELKNQVKRTERSISNDDVKSGGNASSGQGSN